jgi:hypothetical protein
MRSFRLAIFIWSDMLPTFRLPTFFPNLGVRQSVSEITCVPKVQALPRRRSFDRSHWHCRNELWFGSGNIADHDVIVLWRHSIFRKIKQVKSMSIAPGIRDGVYWTRFELTNGEWIPVPAEVVIKDPLRSKN